MACSSLSAFAFFALPGGSMDAAIAAAAGAAAPPPPPSMGPYPSLARAGSAASGSAAAPAGDGDAGESDGCACRVCARPLSGRCGFCDAPGERPAFLCDACCWVCDGCGRAACGGCQGRFSECQQCGYLACDECCTQPDADADGTKLAGAPGCWCDSTRKRDVGNRRYVSRDRYKALTLTHPSMRAASMSAAGLRDDEDCDDENPYDDGPWAPADAEGEDAGLTPQSWGPASSGSAAAGGTAGSGRHGSMDLSTDGGSAIRRSLMRYGSMDRRLQQALH